MPNILIVDDSRTMRQLLSFAAKRIPESKMIEAIDGADALKKLSTEKIDIILADVNMPIMDGFELVSHVRKHELYKNIPIIMITTRGAQEDEQRALTIGANAYLTKPVQANDLIRLVRSYLSV
jgi:two-component system chemotaxis response regulator CheY